MPSQQIHLRQRIKAIGTIKKITHAMRLISMSTHTRLRHKKEQLTNYKNAFLHLSRVIKKAAQTTQLADPIEQNKPTEQLIILISSQKGLCGTFNETLFAYFNKNYPSFTTQQRIITIGSYATEFIKRTYNITPFQEFNKFSSTEFVQLAQQITHTITQLEYPEVIVYSNQSYSFFSQKPKKTIIFPISEESLAQDKHISSSEDYIWEQDPIQLMHTVKDLTILILLQELIFDSLFAEQAARFLSMDSATRNADTLLNNTKLEYNKSRQAAITRELTELSSSAHT
jgi:F-type H+-transporting ATPase subunit gamma